MAMEDRPGTADGWVRALASRVGAVPDAGSGRAAPRRARAGGRAHGLGYVAGRRHAVSTAGRPAGSSRWHRTLRAHRKAGRGREPGARVPRVAAMSAAASMRTLSHGKVD